MNQYIKRRSDADFVKWLKEVAIYSDQDIMIISHQIDVMNKVDESKYIYELKHKLEMIQREQSDYEKFLRLLNDGERAVVKAIIERRTNSILDKQFLWRSKANAYKLWIKLFFPTGESYMNAINPKKFGEKLKEARIKAGYSIAMVADYLEISEGAIRNYENGNRMPKLNVFIAVCSVYRIKLNELVIYSQK